MAAGSNTPLNVVDWLAASVRGSVSPVTVNPLPLTLSLDIVRLPLPVFVRVTVFIVLLPVRTLPKLKEVGEADS